MAGGSYKNDHFFACNPDQSYPGGEFESLLRACFYWQRPICHCTHLPWTSPEDGTYAIYIMDIFQTQEEYFEQEDGFISLAFVYFLLAF